MRNVLVLLLLAASLVAGDKAPTPFEPPVEFLTRAQLPSGAWPDQPGKGPDVQATSLSVLTLLGAGHVDRGSSPQAVALRNGLAFLRRIDGRIGESTLQHAQATLVLCEAYAMTRNPLYKQPAREAVRFLVRLQEDDGSFGELVPTGWAGFALVSAERIGIDDGKPARARLGAWLQDAKDGSQRAIAVKTALRVLTQGDAERIRAGIEALGAQPPSASDDDPVYAYFGAMATYRAGGPAWRAWSKAIGTAVAATRRGDGSWSATTEFGTVASTAYHALGQLIHGRFEAATGGATEAPDRDLEEVEEEAEVDDSPFSGPSTNAAIGLGGGAGRGGIRRARHGGRAWNTEAYDRIESKGFVGAWENDVSTFSVDVDTAAYSNVRRFLLQEGRLPPRDAVRIEEMVNYFPYGDAPPEAGAEHPFRVHAEVAACPWQPKHRLVRVALKAKEIEIADRPASNLVFLLDVSGSMSSEGKLPLLKRALRLLVERLDERDSVSIVVYAGAAGLALPPTAGSDRETILGALDRLQAGGSTNGGQGIALAYAVAKEQLRKDGINRVLLCTDGDFNVGISDRGALTRYVEEEAKAGVGLSILGFGTGNLKDARLEELSNKGDGNYAYIDTIAEARKVLVEQLTGTLVTVAKDAKVQVFFNPARVGSWRLIGYENRVLQKEDFNDDKKDAGEIGAGHAVTALYEIVPAAEGGRKSDDNPFFRAPALTEEAKNGALFRLRLRYKKPGAEASVLLERDVEDEGRDYADAGDAFRWSSTVAMFGLLLRDDEHKGVASYAFCEEIANAAVGEDPKGYRKQMLDMLARAKILAAVQ